VQLINVIGISGGSPHHYPTRLVVSRTTTLTKYPEFPYQIGSFSMSQPWKFLYKIFGVNSKIIL